MKIMVCFVDGDSVIIEDVCPMNRLISALKQDVKEGTAFIVINDILIALDKITYIMEVKENEDE